MRGKKVSTAWRTAQLFISSQAAGVFEVDVNTETKALRCSCPVWKKVDSCKHVSFVSRRIALNGGHYSIQIPHEIPEEMAIEASDTPEKFREFVLKYAKIEVL